MNTCGFQEVPVHHMVDHRRSQADVAASFRKNNSGFKKRQANCEMVQYFDQLSNTKTSVNDLMLLSLTSQPKESAVVAKS